MFVSESQPGQCHAATGSLPSPNMGLESPVYANVWRLKSSDVQMNRASIPVSDGGRKESQGLEKDLSKVPGPICDTQGCIHVLRLLLTNP